MKEMGKLGSFEDNPRPMMIQFKIMIFGVLIPLLSFWRLAQFGEGGR